MVKKISEEVPTNSAGAGAVDGIGVGPKGEPGGKSAMAKVLNRLKKIRNRRKKDG